MLSLYLLEFFAFFLLDPALHESGRASPGNILTPYFSDPDEQLTGLCYAGSQQYRKMNFVAGAQTNLSERRRHISAS